MNMILFAIMGLIVVKGETMLFDFSSPESSGQWNMVNDGVMGGISKSNMALNSNGTATFSGNVSLENNGGFASTRSHVSLLNEHDFNGVIVSVKGDGKVYNIRFRTNDNLDGYAYQAKIKTIKDNWKEFKIPFSNFKPTFRGYTLENKPALKSKDIAQMGILIADKQPGNFELTIKWIKLYK